MIEVMEAKNAVGITEMVKLTRKSFEEQTFPEDLEYRLKPGYIKDRKLYVFDEIPLDLEGTTIYVAFPGELYTAKSNSPFISPCYARKNIYYIKTERFKWDHLNNKQSNVPITKEEILEELVLLNNIKYKIDKRKF